METLLSLTSKQAGEWFKDTLRTLSGLDQLVRTGLSSRLISCLLSLPDVWWIHWHAVLGQLLSYSNKLLSSVFYRVTV